MGYQNLPIPAGWSLFTVTFKDVTESAYDIRNVVPCDNTGTALTSSKNKFQIQVFDGETGGFATTYKYTTASDKGWCDSNGNQLTDDTTVRLYDGIAILISNTQSGESFFRVAGAVSLNPVSSPIATTGWSLVGNMTPVDVDLRNIVPCSDAAGEAPLTSSKNKIQIQVFDNSTGGFTTTYKYTTASNKGWCDANGTQLTDDTTLTLKPGEAVIVSNTQGSTVYFKFPSPVN